MLYALKYCTISRYKCSDEKWKIRSQRKASKIAVLELRVTLTVLFQEPFADFLFLGLEGGLAGSQCFIFPVHQTILSFPKTFDSLSFGLYDLEGKRIYVTIFLGIFILCHDNKNVGFVT